MTITGRNSFEFSETLTEARVSELEDALAAHGAKVDATAQTFAPDPAPPTYTFACAVEVNDQMAADHTAGIILRRALYDCGYLSPPPPTTRRGAVVRGTR